MTVRTVMLLDKATKNTVKYSDPNRQNGVEGKGVPVMSIYINKTSLPDPPPEQVELLISPVE